MPRRLKPEEKKDPEIKKNISGEFDKTLDEALEYQIKADSLNEIAATQKKQLEKLSPAEKSASRAKIAEYEAAAASFQKLADQKFNEAHNPLASEPVTVKPAVTIPPAFTKRS